MSSSLDLDPTNPLTPTELILLNGEKFAEKESLWDRWTYGSVDLFHVEAKVSARGVGRVMLAAAFLANEQAGAVRLEVGQKKVFFGLFSVTTLFAAPGTDTVNWPTHSLESSVQQLVGEKVNEVSTVIYNLFGQTIYYPWRATVEFIQQGMVRRGLLEVVNEKRLILFTVEHYLLPEHTAALASQQSLAPIRRSLAVCQQSRPEVWNLLQEQINKAIGRRTKAHTGGGGGG